MLPSASSPASRRTFLLTAVASCAIVVTACTGQPAGRDATKKKPDPLAAVLASHAALRDKYAAALTATPTLIPLLTPLHKESIEHVNAIAAAMAQKPPATSPSSGASVPAVPAAPTDPASILAELRALEAAAQQQTTALTTTIAADRAPLIGSIAASHACHLAVLG